MLKKIIKKILPDKVLKRITNYRQRIKLTETIYNDTVSFAYETDVRYSTISDYSSVGRFAKITHTDIGKYCALSWDITINAVSHPSNNLTVHSFPYVPSAGNFVNERKQVHKRVIIKNDVWVGANSVIMPGVTIGNGVIIGSSSVVTKDIPDYAIVAGVPARIIKYRFSKDIIARLLELKWWDLDPKVIKNHIEIWGGEFNCESLKKLEEICK